MFYFQKPWFVADLPAFKLLLETIKLNDAEQYPLESLERYRSALFDLVTEAEHSKKLSTLGYIGQHHLILMVSSKASS